MKYLHTVTFSIITFLLPLAVLAAPNYDAPAVGILQTIGYMINLATPIAVALALLAFLWGLTIFIFQSADPKKRQNGVQMMIWGIIALFVMVSIWGIINVIQRTFDINNGGEIAPPSVSGWIDQLR